MKQSLKDLLERLNNIDFGEQEDQELAERAAAVAEEQAAAEEKLSEYKQLAEEAEARAKKAEQELEEARSSVQETEQEVEAVTNQLTTLLENVRSEVSKVRERQTELDSWRTDVSERYGLIPSSEDEAANRQGVQNEDLVPKEAFEAARKSANSGPVSLFRNIMRRYSEVYGDIYDRPGLDKNASDRSMSHIRTIQALARSTDKVRFV